MSSKEVLDTIIREVRAGRRVALCAVVATRGSTPQPAGAFVCVNEAADMTDTLGGGCIEAEVRRQAHQLLSARRSALLTFTLDNDFGYEDGMICGGRMDVAVDVFSRPDRIRAVQEALDRQRAGKPATLTLSVETTSGPVEYRLHIESVPSLVIVGAGHIGRVLAQYAVPLGFNVSVIDDRSDFANAERFPQPMTPIAGDIVKTLADWPIDANTYVVIVTRGHKHDERALATVLDSPAKYIGMIGSKRKIQVIFDDLRQAGALQERLSRVRAPIGVEIGAVTVAEIAVSIAAELVAVRRAHYHAAVEGPFPVSERV